MICFTCLRGNQVNGLPPPRHSRRVKRRLWLSRADLGPHKMVNQCKNLSCYQCFARRHDEKCRKNKNFQGNIENFRCLEFLKKKRKDNQEMKRHSTSSSCRNLVDGLPHDCYTRTVAKPGRLESAENDEPMQNFVE